MNQCSSTPHHVILEHVFPFLYSKTQMKEVVMEAVISRNVNDLFLLVGSTSGSVPSYLTSDTTFTKSAGFSIMLPVLQGLGFKIARSKFRAASRKGNLDIMKWLKSKDCAWDERVFTISSQNGNLFVMKWLKETGCPWVARTFSAAALYGYLENMKWLNENNCPWGATTFAAAADNGRLENLKWLKEKSCPWNLYTQGKIRRKDDPALLALYPEEIRSINEEQFLLEDDMTDFFMYNNLYKPFFYRPDDPESDDSDQEEDEDNSEDNSENNSWYRYGKDSFDWDDDSYYERGYYQIWKG
mmetsp:Transcript_22051/g.31597  ORF Transcript_22051/g.31597 Transcript_22051/m.31597 type:complete len:299 (+) Transcript_22051:39-935(+)